jgi:hypothetical protein
MAAVFEANTFQRPAVEAMLLDPRNEYLRWRQLTDGTYVAMIKLLFTVAIVIDVDEFGFAKRFCFDNPRLALEQFHVLSDQDSEPIGWVARR